MDTAAVLAFRQTRQSLFDGVARVDDVAARALPTFAVALAMAAFLGWLRRASPPGAWSVPLFIPLTGVFEFLLKYSFSRGIHLAELAAAARELIGDHYHSAASFPSGHVARAVFLGTIASRLLPGFAAAPLVVFAAITFVARVYSEAHRLSDVLGGAALGLFVASAGMWTQAYLQARLSPGAKHEPR